MARHPRSDGTDKDTGFLARWSRRKQTHRDSGAAEEAAEPAVQALEVPPQDVLEPEPQAPVKTDADMPPLESISDQSNMADFFSPGVSEQLRKMALRKLFQSAKFNIRDGLDDYDEDFRDFAALGDIVTADMKHRQEMEKLRAEEEALARGETVPGTPDQATEQAADQTPKTETPAETSVEASATDPDIRPGKDIEPADANTPVVGNKDKTQADKTKKRKPAKDTRRSV